MRVVNAAATLALAASVLLAGASAASADDTDPTGSASPTATDGSQGPTEAGTSFRTAQAFLPGQQATADASTGDYLYWRVPVDVGQRATVSAKVTFPETSVRKAASTWQVDVYDGLRRRQSCMYGSQTKALPPGESSVELRCTLRTVRAWAEPWSNDPLPGDYYIRLTAVRAQQGDLGLPMTAEVDVAAPGKGGAFATGGKLAAPLVPGARTSSTEDSDDSADSGDSADPDATQEPTEGTTSEDVQATADEPDGGWASGYWTDRWLWTGGGAVLAALAGIGGYRLTRPRRHMLPPRAGH